MNTNRQILKIATFMALVLLPFTGIAQNYQCLQSGVKHYFTNSDGYLRGIRIDSVKTYPDSTVFYPYHTPRGRYLKYTHLWDTAGGSWLGKKVIQLNDGTFLFDDIWNDTVVIKTQAHTGDIWTFYDDTTTLYYQAEVIAEDTMSVLGVVDSIKRILITARNPSGIVTTDSVNGIQIVLSKTSGFLQVFDLYTFPYHTPDSLYKGDAVDYFLDFVSMYTPSLANSTFKLVPFSWPAKTQLYNWNVGDAYEIKYCNSNSYAFDCPYPRVYYYDSVISKVVFPDSVQYATVGWEIAQVRSSPDPYVRDKYYPYGRRVVNKTFTVPHIPLFDTSLFPEEYRQPTIYHYFAENTTFCSTGEKYTTTPSLVGVNFHEGGGPDYIYKKDIDLVSKITIGSADFTDEFFGDLLIYYTHNGIRCGNYIGPEALSVREVTNTRQSIALSPNPASDIITITAPEKISQLVIADIVGQTIFKGNYHIDKVQVDISRFAPGMYIAKINGVESVKFIRQ